MNIARPLPHFLFAILMSVSACTDGDDGAAVAPETGEPGEPGEPQLVPIDASPETTRATGIALWEIGKGVGKTVFVGHDAGGTAIAAGELVARPAGGEVLLSRPERGTARFSRAELVDTDLGASGAGVAERLIADLFPEGWPNTRGICPSCSRVRTGGHSDGCGSCSSYGRVGEKVYTWYRAVCWELEYDDGWTCEMDLGNEYLVERCNACQ